MDHQLPCSKRKRPNSSDSLQERVILLLDLDCFYAQCERIRLGFTGPDDHRTCCIALLQWDSCLAVSYPARVYGIQRGDGFKEVAQKSQGKCMAVHVPILETNDTKSIDFDGNYESVYQLSSTEQQRLRAQDIGRRRYQTEGKACLERYRMASRRIFEVVMECLGITSAKPTAGVVLEKASIDEFFLDVSGVCNNPYHPLWKTIENYHNSDRRGSPGGASNPQASHHKTVIVGSENDQGDADNALLESCPPLELGCQVAHYIRSFVFDQLGYTLSAGVSVNKMVSKLAASFGKPNGQAVVVPDQVATVMKDTKLSKVRNFGGKMGKAIVELLPPEAPHTMGSVAKYLSLPQLQDKFGADTAQMVFEACRGHDKETVEPKNSGNVVKSITAFKSLPRNLDADIEDAGLIKWLNLLVGEVVSRVETDAERNHRYPRNCTIQYGCQGQVNAAGRLDMKSFRIPFPPKRLERAQKVSHLMEKIPLRIIERECPSASRGTYRKPIKLVRIGVSATEMNEEVNKHGSIANYFSAATAASKPCNTTKAEQSQPPWKAAKQPMETEVSKASAAIKTEKETPQMQADPDKAQSSVAQVGSSKASNTIKDEEDKDLRMAKELQAAFDREESALSLIDKRSSLSQPEKAPSVAPSSKVAGPYKITFSDSSTGRHNNQKHNSKARQQAASPAEDKDVELARKLQASYDRENSILGSWESRKKGGLVSSGGRPAAKKAKTKKISAFFQASK